MLKSKGILLALISSATFGLIPLFSIPLLRSGMTVESVCFYRFLLAAILMVPCMRFMKKDLRLSKREFVAVFLISSFYAATSLFLTMSYAYIASSVATTIHFLYPVAVALWMMIFFRERLSLMKVIAIVCAITGVLFLSGGFSSDGHISLKGLWIVLITVVTYSTYLVGVNNIDILKNIDSAKTALYVLFFSSIYCFLNIVVRNTGFSAITGANSWMCVFGLALLPTLVSNLTLVYALRFIGSTTTAILGCLEPLTALIMGLVFLGERLNLQQFGGILFVFVAVYLVIKNK
jgi:drug/metabolite transporter (DMT)-like permease